MSQARFDACLAAVLVHEGGYVNHPKDPGGATNMGITHKTLAAHRGVASVTREQVKMLTLKEAATIYRKSYWLPIRGDELPAGLDYALFDFGVNSGVGRAVRFLQQELKARKLYQGAVDGLMGVKTLQAIASVNNIADIIHAFIARRLTFLKRLKGWSTFGRGWQRRVDEVYALATDMAQFQSMPARAPVRPSGVSDCRTPHDVRGACDVSIGKTIEGQAATGVGVGTAGAALSEAAGQLAPLSDYSQVIKYVFIGLLVASIGITLWMTLKNAKSAEVA